MFTTSRPHPATRQHGLSLVELIVGMLIIGIAMAGLLTTMQTSLRRSADPMISKQKLAIAESLLEEILRQPFTWCDPDDANALTATGTASCAGVVQTETRGSTITPLDQVIDYNGLTLSTITDATGTAVSGLAGYSASISVAAAASPLAIATPAASSIATSEVLRVDVTVTAPDASTLTLTGYRLRHSPNAL